MEQRIATKVSYYYHLVLDAVCQAVANYFPNGLIDAGGFANWAT